MNDEKLLVKALEKHDLYVIAWTKHFGRSLIVVKRKKSSPKPGIYGAIFEMIYDVMKDDEPIMYIDKPISYAELCIKIDLEMENAL